MGVSAEHIILYGWNVGFDTLDSWEPADIPITEIGEPTRAEEQQLYKTVYKEMGLDPDGEPSHYVFTHHT